MSEPPPSVDSPTTAAQLGKPPAPFQSFQEAALHEFSRHSVGARFLFVPALYGKNDEPADIAWVCDDVVLLFYCTETGRSYEKGVRHNLRQAKTWLNKWSDQLPLRGSNAFGTFDVPRSTAAQVVVLSVVQCPDAGAELHLEMTRKYADRGVAAIATIPDVTFKALAGMGASLGDFIDLLGLLPKDGSKLAEPGLKSRFVAANRGFLALSRATRSTEAGRRWSDQTLDVFAGVRAGQTEGGSALSAQDTARVLADIGFREIAWLSATAFKAVQTVEAIPPGQVGPGLLVAAQRFGSRTHGVFVVGAHKLTPEEARTPHLTAARESGVIINVVQAPGGVWARALSFSHLPVEMNLSRAIRRQAAAINGKLYTLR